MSSYAVGQKVQVFVFRKWRSGHVTQVGRTRVRVWYGTPFGAKTYREGVFPPEKIRPAPDQYVDLDSKGGP